jgi:serine protease Do
MLDDFKSGLRPAEPQIGIRTRWLTSEYSRQLELPAATGLLIEAVRNGSPAARAGLKGADRRVRFGNQVLLLGGDYITHVDGKPVQEGDDVTRVALKKHAGETIELTVFRNGRSVKLAVTLAPLDDGV